MTKKIMLSLTLLLFYFFLLSTEIVPVAPDVIEKTRKIYRFFEKNGKVHDECRSKNKNEYVLVVCSLVEYKSSHDYRHLKGIFDKSDTNIGSYIMRLDRQLLLNSNIFSFFGILIDSLVSETEKNNLDAFNKYFEMLSTSDGALTDLLLGKLEKFLTKKSLVVENIPTIQKTLEKDYFEQASYDCNKIKKEYNAIINFCDKNKKKECEDAEKYFKNIKDEICKINTSPAPK